MRIGVSGGVALTYWTEENNGDNAVFIVPIYYCRFPCNHLLLRRN